jgi:hypothetical protein
MMCKGTVLCAELEHLVYNFANVIMGKHNLLLRSLISSLYIHFTESLK